MILSKIPHGAQVRRLIDWLALIQGVTRLLGWGTALAWDTYILIGCCQVVMGVAMLTTVRRRLTTSGRLVATFLGASYVMLAVAALATTPALSGVSAALALCLWVEAWSRRYDDF